MKYEGEEKEITEQNESGITVKAKHALLNYTEAIPQFLWQIHEYFLNQRLNSK